MTATTVSLKIKAKLQKKDTLSGLNQFLTWNSSEQSHGAYRSRISEPNLLNQVIFILICIGQEAKGSGGRLIPLPAWAYSQS